MTSQIQECVRVELKNFLMKRPLRAWLAQRAPERSEPFYSSIDLRDGEFKLAPVDANLYPAGFNNVCPDDQESAVEILKPLLQRHLGRVPEAIAILPESHTRNKYYVDNLYELRQMLRRLGVKAEVGWWHDSPKGKDLEPIPLATTDGRTVQAYPFWRERNRLRFSPFDPEFILLNNDFSGGYPAELDGIEQPIEPSPKLGWHSRRKSDFFANYNRLAGELAAEAGVDPWCMQVATKLVTGVDFQEEIGLDRVAAAVDEVLEQIHGEYEARKIDERPFVFVKNNAGTYGIGILRVESGKHLLELNRRERNKMSVGKSHRKIHEVVVQEGIPTRFKVDSAYAEPVIYLMGYELMGGFLRMNPNRGRLDNLNAQGMMFQRLCLSDLRHGANRDLELELVYGTIAQLSVAAMALEIAESEKKA